MAWSDIAGNDWFTFTQAQGSGFTMHVALPTSDDWMTKAEVIEHIDIVHSNLSPFNDNDWVTKNALSSATVYWNVVKSASIAKNDCGGIYVTGSGTSVTYTVPANTYSSTVDQATADALAQADVDANKQSYANAHGSCTLRTTAWRGITPFCVQQVFGNEVMSASAIKSNCGSGYVGIPVVYTIPVNTYYASTQKAANDLAQVDLNTNTQSHANSASSGTYCSLASNIGTGDRFIITCNYPSGITTVPLILFLSIYGFKGLLSVRKSWNSKDYIIDANASGASFIHVGDAFRWDGYIENYINYVHLKVYVQENHYYRVSSLITTTQYTGSPISSNSKYRIIEIDIPCNLHIADDSDYYNYIISNITIQTSLTSI